MLWTSTEISVIQKCVCVYNSEIYKLLNNNSGYLPKNILKFIQEIYTFQSDNS